MFRWFAAAAADKEAARATWDTCQGSLDEKALKTRRKDLQQDERT